MINWEPWDFKGVWCLKCERRMEAKRLVGNFKTRITEETFECSKCKTAVSLHIKIESEKDG